MMLHSLHFCTDIETDDNERYLNTSELEDGIIYEIDVEMISVKEGPGSDHFLQSVF